MKKLLTFILALIIIIPLTIYGADTAMDSFTDDSASVVTTDYLVGYSGTAGYRWTIASIIAEALKGTAAKATALAANGANCDAGSAPLGVNDSGAVESCFAVVPSSLYDAYGIVYSDTDNTPAFLSMGANTIPCRKASGGIAACSAAEALALIGAVSDTGYDGSWDGVTTIAPSKNAVYDEFVAVHAALPTAASLHLDDVLTALGIASEAVNFGSFTGSTIPDNQTAKAAMQALETAVEGKVSSSSSASYTEPGSNIPLCRTGAGTIGGCTNVTDLAFSSYAPLANPQFTGVVDIAANATTDAEGEITIDTTTDQLRYYGAAQKVLPSVQYASFVIPAPVATDDILIMKAPYGMTLTGVDCIVQGTTSITGQLQECSATGGDCADTDSDITCDADGAAADGTFSNGSIDSGDWILWKTTSVSGTPTFLTVTFKFTVVAD